MAQMTLYVAHSSRHNDHAARSTSGLGALSASITVLCSKDFDDLGHPRQVVPPGPYATRDQCLQDAEALIVIVPPPKDAPVADMALGVQVGEYKEICRAAGRAPTTFCLHHPDIDVSEILKQCPSPPDTTVLPATADNVRVMIARLCPSAPAPIVQTVVTLLLASVDAQVPTRRHTTASTLTLGRLTASVGRPDSRGRRCGRGLVGDNV